MHFVSFLLTNKNGAFSVRDLAISWAKDITRCVNKQNDQHRRTLTSVHKFEELTSVEAAWIEVNYLSFIVVWNMQRHMQSRNM